jgi:hypothetical protein
VRDIWLTSLSGEDAGLRDRDDCPVSLGNVAIACQFVHSGIDSRADDIAAIAAKPFGNRYRIGTSPEYASPYARYAR